MDTLSGGGEGNCCHHTGKAATGTDTDLWSSELSAAKCMERQGCSGRGKWQSPARGTNVLTQPFVQPLLTQALGWALARKPCSQNVSVLVRREPEEPMRIRCSVSEGDGAIEKVRQCGEQEEV